MIKIVFVFIFLGWIGFVHAQEVKIKRSDEVVVWKGKSYYLHTVQPGQTLFSICKAYGVDVEEVKLLNGKKNNELTINEVLRIPYVEPFKRLDDQFYYYKMKPKETLYSLSNRFGIRLKRILKDNPEYNEKDPISMGAVVRLALKLIDKNVLEAELAWEDRRDQELLKQDSMVSAIRLEESKKQGLESEIPNENQYPIQTYPSEPITSSYHVKVALLLPFYLEGNHYPGEKPFDIDSLLTGPQEVNWKLFPKSEPFLHFYEGILMAADSLKKEGYTVELRVFDTERNTSKARMIANELNHYDPQLIFGPVYSNTFQVIADQLYNKSIPMIYPLSSRAEGLGRYSNFVQVNTSTSTLVDNMADWIAKNSEKAHLVVIRPGGEVTNTEESRLPGLVRSRLSLEADRDIQTINWRSTITVDTLKKLLKPGKENMILFPTINEAAASRVLPVLSALPDSYKVTVIGFPEWLKFTTLEDDVFFRLNVRLFMNNYVNHQSEAAKYFADKHRKYFYSEPTPIANRAFDIGLFFMKQVADYGYQTLGHLRMENKEGLFTKFKFRTMPGGGLENYGLYLIHFTSNYEIKVKPVN